MDLQLDSHSRGYWTGLGQDGSQDIRMNNRMDHLAGPLISIAFFLQFQIVNQYSIARIKRKQIIKNLH